MAVLLRKGEDDFRAGGVVETVDVTVVGCQAVGAVGAADDLFAQAGALVIFGRTDEDFRIHQQPRLEDAVGRLVHGVDLVLFQGRKRLVEVFLDESIDLLAAGVEVFVSRRRDPDGLLVADGQGTAPQFEDVVVLPGTQGADLADVLVHGFLAQADGRSVDGVQVGQQVVAEADGLPGGFPGLTDDRGFRGPGLGGKDEFQTLVPAPAATVPGAPGNLVGGELLQVEAIFHETVGSGIVDGADGALDVAFVLIVFAGADDAEGLLVEVEARNHRGRERDERDKTDDIFSHNVFLLIFRKSSSGRA